MMGSSGSSGNGTGVGRSPGRTRGTTFTSKRQIQPPPADMFRTERGFGAPQPSGVTMRAATDLDQWYAQHGCTACDDMGSDLRVRTLAFKCAVLLDPATQNNVSLNVTTPLAQSGFGPGTDAALTLVLGATRQSKGYCTDDNGFCTVAGAQSPAIPPELQALGNALGVSVGNLISQGQQVPQTDATLTVLVGQVVAMFKQFAEQLKMALGQTEQPHPPPMPPSPAVPMPNTVVPLGPPTVVAKAPSSVGMALGVVGIALVALGTGAVIVTYANRRKAKR